MEKRGRSRTKQEIPDDMGTDINDFSMELIEEVRNKPELWNRNQDNYTSRELRKSIWEEIGMHFGMSAEVVRDKWINLRKSYRKLVFQSRKLEKSGQNKSFKPVWRHYRRMSFLKDHICHKSATPDKVDSKGKEKQPICYTNKRISSNAPSLNSLADNLTPEQTLNMTRSNLTSSSANAESSRLSVEKFEPLNGSVSDGSPLPAEKLKAFSESCLNTIALNVEHLQKRLANPTQYQDEDYFFVMSLLPSLAHFPHEKKIKIRAKVQQLLYEEYEALNVEKEECF